MTLTIQIYTTYLDSTLNHLEHLILNKIIKNLTNNTDQDQKVQEKQKEFLKLSKILTYTPTQHPQNQTKSPK
jgi:hypothetical protein